MLVTSSSILGRLHQKLTSGRAINDFELSVILNVIDELDSVDAETLRSQISFINSSYRDHDVEKNKMVVYYYWKYFGKNRLDFPLKWYSREEETRLARVKISYGDKLFISANLFVVLGCFFYIEFESNTYDFVPPSPNFKVEELEVFNI